MNGTAVTRADIEQTYQKLNREAESGGYHLNPDMELTLDLVKGLLVNGERFGYPSCPCRLASGIKQEDLDIICPCDYRDPDLQEYGACYCALYVSGDIAEGKREAVSIPERRPSENERQRQKTSPPPAPSKTLEKKLPYPVWRCKVCGYLCARDSPPEVCPVCKAKRERFERFI